jgi:all-trans-retinol 13,14-reductase
MKTPALKPAFTMKGTPMNDRNVDRREFLKTLAGSLSLTMLDWDSLPTGNPLRDTTSTFDAVIIGSGLGGLSCAAAFARQGFKPVVLEKHDRAGGYATTFTRPGGFVFDVSLHSTTAGERNGVHNLIPGFPEITDVEFVPHPHLYRAIYPDYDIRVPQRNVQEYINLLAKHFPEEQSGIKGLLEDMKGVSKDIARLSAARGQIDMSKFPQEFPTLFKCSGKTWGEMMDPHIKDPKLKAIVSTLWGYYGLPPSKLTAFYYALPTLGYLEEGGQYVRGRSQTLSNAMVKFIEDRGGKVLLKTRASQILTRDHSAYGVKTEDGREFLGKVVVSNANTHDTLSSLTGEGEYLKEYIGKLDQLDISLSSFQVFLGLKKDLVGRLGITDTEIFYDTGYDHERSYASALNADVERGGYLAALYDNIYKGYSPEGKNTLNILVLQGFDHWKDFEADYFKGNKKAYHAEKERIAKLLVRKAEETLLPGLSDSIEVMEIGTPLTNLRYTANTRGAVYGFDQTVRNSGAARLPHKTPIRNLYLSGAWTRPGHGYGGVIGSGLECFGEIMKEW